MMNLLSKREALEKILKDLQSVLVAYSGGTDSTFLLKVAVDVLGDRVTAVTASSETYTMRKPGKLPSQLGYRILLCTRMNWMIPISHPIPRTDVTIARRNSSQSFLSWPGRTVYTA